MIIIIDKTRCDLSFFKLIKQKQEAILFWYFPNSRNPSKSNKPSHFDQPFLSALWEMCWLSLGTVLLISTLFIFISLYIFFSKSTLGLATFWSAVCHSLQRSLSTTTTFHFRLHLLIIFWNPMTSSSNLATCFRDKTWLNMFSVLLQAEQWWRAGAKGRVGTNPGVQKLTSNLKLFSRP